MRIDAHQHYWKLSRNDYGWLTAELGVLYRDYLPADLKPLMDRTGIDQTVVVQAAPTVAETEFLLDLADSEESIAGVVGWLDMESETFVNELRRLAKRPKFLGIRPMIQNLADDQWMLRPQVKRSFKVLSEVGCAFDFLVFPRHLDAVYEILQETPGLRAVIDHLAKPPIASGNLDPWRGGIERVAGFPNVYCKLSGMVTEAERDSWSVDKLRPFALHVFDQFGPDRVMFGSDWPVCLLAASYEQVVGAAKAVLSDRLTPEVEESVFGGNAARFYGVG